MSPTEKKAAAKPSQHADPAKGVDSVPEQQFLGRELRVGLTDGRVFTGVCVAFEGSGNLMLHGVVEHRSYASSATTEQSVETRPLNLVAIPFKHVVSMHRRLEGYPVTTAAAPQQ